MDLGRTTKADSFFETAYLVLFTWYIFIQTLWSTTLEFTAPAYGYETLEAALLGLIFAKGWTTDAKAQKVHFLCAGGVAFMYLAVAYNRNTDLFRLALFCIAARGVSSEKIMGVYLTVRSVVLAFAVVCAQSGISTNYVYDVNGRGTREAMGICYPTDFAAHVLFLMLAYVYLRGAKMRWAEVAALVAVACYCYYKTDARNDFICMMLLCVLLVIMKLSHRGARAFAKKREAKLKTICVFLMPFLAWLSVASAAFYTQENAIYNKIDMAFSNRLRLGSQGLAQYGISLFGQPIYERGSGMGATAGLSETYFFLDSSYVRTLIIDGLAVFLVVLCIYAYITQKLWAARNWYGVLVVAIVALATFFEHHMMELYYNPFILLLLATPKEISDHKQIEDIRVR